MSEKPALGLAGQLALLRERKFIIEGDDDQRMIRLLLNRGYFRASGYWRYFQVAPHFGDDNFVAGTTVTQIIEVYDFDETLRNILLSGLATFEVAFKARLAEQLAMNADLGPYAYLEELTYLQETGTDESGRPIDYRAALLKKIGDELGRAKVAFIKRHITAGERVPIWEAVEALSFGTVSKMFGLLNHDKVQSTLAQGFLGKADGRRLGSTVQSLVVLRNMCAHHTRIWNARPAISLSVPLDLKTDPDKSIYNNTPWALVVTLAFMVDRLRIDPKFSRDLWAHIDTHPQYLEGLQYPHNR